MPVFIRFDYFNYQAPGINIIHYILLNSMYIGLGLVIAVKLLSFIFFSNKFPLITIQVEEIGNIDDLLFFFTNLILLVVVSVFNIYVALVIAPQIMIYVPFYFIWFNLMWIPVLYKYMCGFNFISFIRGCATTLVLIYEYVLDISNIISFFLRILLQFIRICMILITLYTFYQLWNEFKVVVDYILQQSLRAIIYLYTFILYFSHYIFEIGHFFIVFAMQIIAFTVMVGWLFQFLYTTYIRPLLER